MTIVFVPDSFPTLPSERERDRDRDRFGQPTTFVVVFVLGFVLN